MNTGVEEKDDIKSKSDLIHARKAVPGVCRRRGNGSQCGESCRRQSPATEEHPDFRCLRGARDRLFTDPHELQPCTPPTRRIFGADLSAALRA